MVFLWQLRKCAFPIIWLGYQCKLIKECIENAYRRDDPHVTWKFRYRVSLRVTDHLFISGKSKNVFFASKILQHWNLSLTWTASWLQTRIGAVKGGKDKHYSDAKDKCCLMNVIIPVVHDTKIFSLKIPKIFMKIGLQFITLKMTWM